MATEFNDLDALMGGSGMPASVPMAPVGGDFGDLDQQMARIGGEGPPANAAPSPVPFRFRDPGDDSFGKRFKDSGEHNMNAVMEMTRDPVHSAKMIAGMFSKDGLNALGDYFVKSYGSVDNAKKTATNDPMGFLSDLSGIASVGRIGAKTAGMPKTAAAMNVVENLDPMSAIQAGGRFAGAQGASQIPALNPENIYENLLKMPVTPTSKYRNRKTRSGVIETLLDNKISPTPKGVDRLQKLVRSKSNALDDIIDKAEQQGRQIPASDVYRNVLDMRKETIGMRGNPERTSELRSIHGWMKQWQQSMGDKQFFTPNELRELRQAADSKLPWNNVPSVEPPMKRQLREQSAHGMRSALAEGVPEAGPVTKQISTLLDAAEPLERASARLGNNNRLPLNNVITGSAGAGIMASGAASGSTLATIAGAIMTGKALLWTPAQKAKVAQLINQDRKLANPVKRNLVRQLYLQGTNKSQAVEEQQQYMEQPQ